MASLTSTALDNDIVERMLVREFHELRKKILSQCAADAPVLQSDDLLLCLGDAMCVLNQGSIDVYPAGVIKYSSMRTVQEESSLGGHTLQYH